MNKRARRLAIVVGTVAMLLALSLGGWIVGGDAPDFVIPDLFGTTSAHKGAAAAAKPAPPGPGSPSAPSPQNLHGYREVTYTAANGMHMTYYLYIPSGYDPTQQYPLVLLLHGSGEMARPKNTPTRNQAVLMNQAYVQLWTGSAVQARWPSFVVVPQVRAPDRWVDVPSSKGSYTLQQQPSASLSMTKQIVDLLQTEYTGIDPHRIYVTGISMGGFGVWDAIERWPSYFAAAVPIAGAGDPTLASELVHLPLWDFQGTADKDTPATDVRGIIQAIRDAGGTPCYSEFLGMPHEIWMQAYQYENGRLLAWMFAQGTPAAANPDLPHCAP